MRARILSFIISISGGLREGKKSRGYVSEGSTEHTPRPMNFPGAGEERSLPSGEVLWSIDIRTDSLKFYVKVG